MALTTPINWSRLMWCMLVCAALNALFLGAVYVSRAYHSHSHLAARTPHPVIACRQGMTLLPDPLLPGQSCVGTATIQSGPRAREETSY